MITPTTAKRIFVALAPVDLRQDPLSGHLKNTGIGSRPFTGTAAGFGSAQNVWSGDVSPGRKEGAKKQTGDEIRSIGSFLLASAP